MFFWLKLCKKCAYAVCTGNYSKSRALTKSMRKALSFLNPSAGGKFRYARIWTVLFIFVCQARGQWFKGSENPHQQYSAKKSNVFTWQTMVAIVCFASSQTKYVFTSIEAAYFLLGDSWYFVSCSNHAPVFSMSCERPHTTRAHGPNVLTPVCPPHLTLILSPTFPPKLQI